MKKKIQDTHGTLIDMLGSAQLRIDDKIGFLSLIEKQFNEISTKDQKIHGFRTQHMFAYIAGALGKHYINKI